MSEQQSAAPQYSPDGQWWWNGREWVPAVPRRQGRSAVTIVLLVVGGLLGLLVVGVLLVGSLLAPVGTQHDTAEVEGYCEVFPEDC